MDRGRELRGLRGGRPSGLGGESACLEPLLRAALGAGAEALLGGTTSDQVLSAAPRALTGPIFYSELGSPPPAQPIETLPTAD